MLASMSRFKQSSLLLVWFFALIGGLVLARRLPGPPGWCVGVVLVFAFATYNRRTFFSLILVLLAGISLGAWRGSLYMNHLAEFQNLFGQTVTVKATVAGDAIYGDKGQLSFDVTKLQLLKPVAKPLVGGIRVQGLGVSMLYRGDVIQISGLLSPTKGSNQARMSYAKVRLQQRGGSPLDVIRRWFVAGLASVLPEPSGSFGAGLLIGQRSTIPKETNDQLSSTGLTHLVAVSGYNLTIIIMAARRLLGKGSKYQSTFFAVLLIITFVLVTGLSASIVRAALVSILSLIAWYYGRTFRPLVLISLAASSTALWNPYYLWSDIGWYLSFLAFFGVMLVGPLITGLLSKPPKLFLGLLIETTSAQLLTLPIIMYIFGRLSVIGLVSNLLVVPLVPLAMLLSLVTGLSGGSSIIIGGWIAWPGRLLLGYMLDIISLLSQFPHASVQKPINLQSMLGMYAAILVGMVVLHRLKGSPEKPKYDRITDRKGRYVRSQQMVNHQTTEGR